MSKPAYLILVLLSVGLWLALTFDALLGMELIWRRSDTFAHGYFILPISIWIVWRSKNEWSRLNFEFSRLGLIPLLASALIYLFGVAADINALMQLSAISMLICILWILVGDKVAWNLKFPLVFLFFLAPVGQGIIPALQDITAWFTVFFLQLTGIPVFRDGLFIQTPTGLFEVAVACSGIRYLIASAAVGALYAYLTYSKLKKQVIFFIFALILPIVANGVRAYLIVAIAHYSDMKYATGADHLVYGWIFFGFVIMLLFWIGGFFADKPENPIVTSPPSFSLSTSITSYVTIGTVIAIILFANILQKGMKGITPPQKPERYFVLKDTEYSNWGITFHTGLTRSQVKLPDNSELLLAQYANKQTKGKLVSWDNKWYSPDKWTLTDRYQINTSDNQFAGLSLKGIDGRVRQVAYQYVIGEYQTPSQVQAKLYQALNVLVQERSSAKVIAISTNSQSKIKPEDVNRALVWIDRAHVKSQIGGDDEQ